MLKEKTVCEFRFIVMVALVANFVVGSAGLVANAQSSDKPPINNKIYNAMVEIQKHMEELSIPKEEITFKKIAKHSKEINIQFESIDKNEIPKEVSSEFSDAKEKFANYYKTFLEVADEDIEAIIDHTNESARTYGQSWDELLVKTRNLGFDVEVRARDKMIESRAGRTKLALKYINNICNVYLLEIGQAPTSFNDLLNKPADEQIGRKWNGPYLNVEHKLPFLAFEKGIPVDAWGTKLSMSFNKETYRMEIKSAGPDKKFGTKDDLKH